jgi:DTW domain-containing protein YfiP
MIAWFLWKALLNYQTSNFQSELLCKIFTFSKFRIQHPKELKSKSTAIHAKILSPDYVDIYQYPEIPEFLTQENSMILYPSKDSVSFENLIQKNEKSEKKEDFSSLKYLVFIDATWNQAKSIAKDERIQSLKKLKITTQTTLFWRLEFQF